MKTCSFNSVMCHPFLSPIKHGHGHGWPPVSPATGTAQSDGSMARQRDAYRAGAIWEPEQVNSIYYCHYCYTLHFIAAQTRNV